MCRIFIKLKQLLNSKDHLDKSEDPFWLLLTKDENDFYTNENIIMMISIIKMTTLFVESFSHLDGLDYAEHEFEYFPTAWIVTTFYTIRSFEGLYWWYLIWSGTTHQ
jgi:hypothetical protein